MKKIIIIMTAIFCSVLSSMAQDYVPLVREGVKWKCGTAHKFRITPEKNYISQYTILFKGDTIIGDYIYKNCLVIPEGYPEEVSDSTLVGFAREDVAEKKVYYLVNLNFDFEKSRYIPSLTPCGNDSYREEAIWYDFNDMRNSSELKLAFWNQDVTINIDYVDISGQKRKRHNMEYGYGIFSVIEGVGSSGDFSLHGDSKLNHGNLLCRVPQYPSNMIIHSPIFFHFEDADGNIIYDAPSDPPGIDGIEEVAEAGEEAVEVARYDVHGRRLAKPVPGINIVRMSDGTVRKQIEKNGF